MPGATCVPAAARSYEHPARAAEVLWRGRRIGRLFELHPSLVETGRAAMLDLDLRVLQTPVRGGEKRYTPIRRYPSSAFDLSVMAGLRELAGDIQKKLAALRRRGPANRSSSCASTPARRSPRGTKSVSFRLTVAAHGRTLSSDEVGAIRTRIIDGMRALGYELRV